VGLKFEHKFEKKGLHIKV